MPSQDLQRDDKGIRHQVVVHSGVEDLDAAVIRRGGEEGVGGVEVEGADGAGVVPEGGDVSCGMEAQTRGGEWKEMKGGRSG